MVKVLVEAAGSVGYPGSSGLLKTDSLRKGILVKTQVPNKIFSLDLVVILENVQCGDRRVE